MGLRTPAALTLAACVLVTACGSAAPQAVATGTTTPPPTSAPTASATATATATAAIPTPPPGTPVPTPPPCTTNACVLATWSVARLAAQTVVVPVDEGGVGAVSPQVAGGAGGVILFGSAAPANLGSALAALGAVAPGGIRPLVMTDEEGGAVQRMANVAGWIPDARTMGATMTPAQISALAEAAARRMRAAGVTMDLAPVLDLDAGPGPSDTDADGTRSFSATPSVAGAAGTAFAQGLQAGGVAPVIKHFPGLGGATPNTDIGPAWTAPWPVLQGAGLLPFEQALRGGAGAVMIANARVPGLTSLPAGLSASVVTGVLRQQLGFGGLVLTDSLSAGSVSAAGYSVPAAAVAALAAGCDMVLFTAAPGAVGTVTSQIVQAVTAAVASGALPRQRLIDAVAHILSAKSVTLAA